MAKKNKGERSNPLPRHVGGHGKGNHPRLSASDDLAITKRVIALDDLVHDLRSEWHAPLFGDPYVDLASLQDIVETLMGVSSELYSLVIDLPSKRDAIKVTKR